jgi:hypothetical protein
MFLCIMMYKAVLGLYAIHSGEKKNKISQLQYAHFVIQYMINSLSECNCLKQGLKHSM